MIENLLLLLFGTTLTRIRYAKTHLTILFQKIRKSDNGLP